MKRWTGFNWLGVLVVATLAACGGGNDGGAPAGGGGTAPTTPPSGQLGAALTAAAAVPGNDSASNSSSAFTVLQANGVPAVTVAGAPVVNFTVFSDGQVKQGLTLSDVSFAIAKLVPGTNGEIDQWQSYVYRTESTANAPNNVGSGPNGTPVLASATQATTDPKPASQPNQLVYRPEGYYTYTFSTNITDPAKTNGIVFEPGRTHRIAIQLRYRNAAGATILVNPYVDVTFDANGRSVFVTDPSKTRVMADVSSCNGCHEKLALHGGGRVDTQYCVMCHNPGTTDANSANSGNVLTMQTMTHKIHAGRLLAGIDPAIGGGRYVIWGFQSSKHDYSEVGFPQDLRNCSVCHSGANPKTPQGDNWKTRTSKEACFTCHVSGTGSGFDLTHRDFALAILGPNGKPQDIPNGSCAECHRAGTAVSPERVHWNQNEENSARYQVKIDSAIFDAAGRKVTVRYSVVDTTNGNAPWNLVTSDCTGSGATLACSNTTRFGNLRFYLAYANMVGQPAGVTEFTAYNNGGSGANAFLYKGTNDGSNRYTIDIPLPADSVTAVAQGTARVVGVGQIKEPKLQVKSATDPRPEVTPRTLINVIARHTSADVALSGPLNPRRQVVSNEKCNVCHGALGTTSGSNTLAEAFHSGARNTVEACALCHDQNRYSSTVMTNGQAWSENYSFKRMIHGIHGNSKRTYPFTHGNNVIGAFNKSGILTLDGLIAASSSSSVAAPPGTLLQPWSTGVVVPAGTQLGASGSAVENYAAEVAYPQLGLNCDSCHVDRSWRDDPNPVGSVVAKPIDAATSKAGTDPLAWRVISPKAASCSSCHDSPTAIGHMISSGSSSFGNLTQGQSFQVPESCAECHAAGRPLGVDVVHGQK
ncbi:MAG: OmcA/MtrC family decaheme c-type cytochrome [Xanthomonadales bacterium]|nr:OmcA/MtrC family decaheme c-type cytochrome [Xanthomonadales bacterium]